MHLIGLDCTNFRSIIGTQETVEGIECIIMKSKYILLEVAFSSYQIVAISPPPLGPRIISAIDSKLI